MNDNNDRLINIDAKEFWFVFGDINQLLALLVTSSHLHDEEALDLGAQACATLMAKLASVVMPDASTEEIILEMDKAKSRWNDLKVYKERDFTNDRN